MLHFDLVSSYEVRQAESVRPVGSSGTVNHSVFAKDSNYVVEVILVLEVLMAMMVEVRDVVSNDI